MARGGEDIYGNYGSVPTAQPTGLNAPAMGVRANPEDMGAAIGAGVQKVGEAGEQVANTYGGMIMETAANQAELGYIKASGDLHAKYSQYEGLQAEAMRPQYATDLEALHQQYRNNLPLMAQKMFDSTTVRSMGNQVSEYSNYAAGQVKSANLTSFEGLSNASIAKAGNLPTVTDPQQFGELNGTIIHAENSIADTKGWGSLATGTDPDTGKLTFGDSPQAQATKAQYEQDLGKKQADLYETAAKTIYDNHGATASADWVKSQWNNMPDQAKVRLNQFLAPKMVNEDIDGAIATANSNMAANKQKEILSNVPKSPTEPLPSNAPLAIRNNNPGNLRDSSTGQFRVFDTPEAGTAAMQADLTAKVSGKSPSMEANFGKQYSPTLSNIITTYAPKSENNTKAYIDTVSKDTGFAPDQVLTVKDISKLQVAMTKVEVGGSGKSISPSQPQEQQKQYSNDYDRLTDQRQSFIDNAVNAITEKRGTDVGLIATVQKRAEANIDAQIRVAKGVLDSDQKNVQGAIDGSMTKGQVPMTLEQLRSVPNMASLVDKIQREQPELYNSIPTRIAKAQPTNATQNSPNSYDAIQATLDTSKPYSRQERIEYLSKGLGSENPGYSISQKDYNDAKPAVDLTDGQSYLGDNMKAIAQANGNIDGKGQERAVQWYNQVMALRQSNQAGDKKMSDADFFDPTKNTSLPSMPMPSRIQQLNSVAAKEVKNPPPIITTREQRDALAVGSVYTRDGKQYTKQ